MAQIVTQLATSKRKYHSQWPHTVEHIRMHQQHHRLFRSAVRVGRSRPDHTASTTTAAAAEIHYH